MMGHVLFLRKGSVHTRPIALPPGYTRLLYIQSTGTQYADTGFKPTGKTRVVCEFCAYDQSTTKQGVFGARNGTSGRFTLFTGNSTASVQADYSTVETLSKWDIAIAGMDLTSRTKIDMSHSLIINGVTVKTVSIAEFNSNHNMYIFANNNAGTTQLLAKMKLWYFQLYNDDTLIRDYIPCINASDEVGLYDLVTQAFFGNAGTGVFTGGEAT